jgi:HEAT repeat protein
MTKNKALATFFILIACLGAVAYGFLKPNEPSDQNIGIKDWLGKFQFATSHHDLQKRTDAQEAIKAIGVEGAPYIIAELRKNSSALRKTYRNLFTRPPAWLQRFAPSPRDEFKFRTGSSALLTIGPSVNPVLISELKSDVPSVLSASALALGHLAFYYGTDIKDAIPALIDCLKHGDIDVRMASVTALSHLGLDAARCRARCSGFDSTAQGSAGRETKGE